MSCLLLFLFTSQLGLGQTYNPFPGEYTYTYVFELPGDTFLQGTRVDTSYGLGPDTIHVFNRTCRLNNALDFFGNCQGGVSLPVYDPSVDNRFPNQPGIFGDSMVQKPGGRFDFLVGPGQDVFRLETQVPVGTSWTLNALRGITATLDSVRWGSFLGLVDSVQHISLCNGQAIVLSRTHGFVHCTPWVPLFHQNAPSSTYPPQYKLYGVEEPGWGAARIGFEEIYDFGNGDYFQIKEETQAGNWESSDKTTGKLMLNWQSSPQGAGGAVEQESLEFSESFGLLDTVYMAPVSVPDTANAFLHPEVELAVEGMAWPEGLSQGYRRVLEESRLLAGRQRYSFREYYCIGNSCQVDGVGYERNWQFHENLGMVYRREKSPFGAGTSVTEKTLTCYQTSWGNGGTCVVLLALANSLEDEFGMAAYSLIQNPLEGKVWLSRVREGSVFNIYDLKGKAISVQSFVDDGEDLEINLGELPAGVFLAELRLHGELLLREKVIVLR